MSELKTQANDGSVEAFLGGIENERRRAECFVLLRLMEEVTGEKGVMWGSSIVGFGRCHYRYESGREGDWFLAGFSPRKQNLTLYIMGGFEGYEGMLARLGKYKTGKSCLYVNKLADVDVDVLREVVQRSVEHMGGGS